MHCPFCSANDTKVTDTRLVAEGKQIKRRRECESCNARFTTYEKAELVYPRVIKNNGTRQPFDETKLRAGIRLALHKRSAAEEDVENLIQTIFYRIRSIGEREISSSLIGETIMNALKTFDQVAYVRFASVYRSFQDIEAFKNEIKTLKTK